MGKPKQPPSVLNTVSRGDDNAFVSYADGNLNTAFSAYGKALDRIEPIQRSTGALANQFSHIDRNASVRSGFSRLDYEFFRPAESVPRHQKQIIAACMAAYDKIGIVRNIIDTMADFAVQGIRFEHPNKQIEEFYNSWFRRVNGLDRSERFLNLFYRAGNVLVKRSRGKIKKSSVVDEFKRGIAQEHLNYEDDFESVNYREIPLRYTFLNPMSVDAVAQEITPFTGKNYYTIKIPPRLISIINNPRDEYELGMVNSIPTDILNGAKNGFKEIKISDDDLVVYHYKKDDWQVWANPMTYAILDDLITLEKMKLADLAALDGAISHIRIWKLGSLEHQILPTDAAIAKLSDLLLNNVGGGSMDLIWGPDLELDETSTSIQSFLGSAKYEVCLSSIYAGLGVPPTMTGASSGGGGFNQNFISLKTLTERLKYGRNNLQQFWEYEVKMVQKAMKFKQAPTIIFDFPNLGDEIAEKALWIQAVDRGLVSDEAFRDKFGVNSEVERKRTVKEAAQRKAKRLPPKASPFHDAQPDLSLAKIFAQRGVVTPGEVDLVLEDRPKGEKTFMEQQEKMQIETKKVAGQPGQGRPKNAKDSKQRKRRATKAEEFVGLAVWAQEAQKAIAGIVNPFILEQANKTDTRQLTDAETKEGEALKFAVMLSLPAYSSIDEETIYNAVQSPLSVYNTEVEGLVNQFGAEISQRRGEGPNLDETRKIHCLVYAMVKGEFDGDSNYND